MTLDEAIAILDNMWECLFKEITNNTFKDLKESGLLDKYFVAHKMAIKALEQQPLIEQFKDMDDRDKIARLLAMALEQPKDGDKVSIEVLKQVMWERDIAIQQLKELGYSLGEKIEPQDGDLISRQAVMNAYCQICMSKNICYRNKESCKDLTLFRQLPSVQPKTGHWNLYHEGRYDESYVCSECDGYSMFDYKYCPNCGARMGVSE